MSERLNKAIGYATECHNGQKRKLSGEPYILHPMEVAIIISTLTSDEDVIIAGLLHDVVEDTPATMEDVKEGFGERVAALVAAESENKRSEMPPDASWQMRKEESIAGLKATKDKNVRILWLADKLANMRSIARYYFKAGDTLWEHFHNKNKSSHYWYYNSVLDAVKEDLGETAAFKEYEALIKYVFEE